MRLTMYLITQLSPPFFVTGLHAHHHMTVCPGRPLARSSAAPISIPIRIRAANPNPIPARYASPSRGNLKARPFPLNYFAHLQLTLAPILSLNPQFNTSVPFQQSNLPPSSQWLPANSNRKITLAMPPSIRQCTRIPPTQRGDSAQC